MNYQEVVAKSFLDALVGEETALDSESYVDEKHYIDLVEFIEPEDVLQVLVFQSVHIKVGHPNVSCGRFRYGTNCIIAGIMP